MEAFLFSTGFVALAEIGDKTQLLPLARRPASNARPHHCRHFVATVLNHALAGSLGSWLTALVPADIMRWVLGGSFLHHGGVVADSGFYRRRRPRLQDKLGVIGATTVIAFSWPRWATRRKSPPWRWPRFDSLMGVVMGTTAGMMLANVPAVLLAKPLPNAFR